MEGDAEANYAYYALHKLHLLPGRFVRLPRREKAFVMACIDVRIAAEKKQAAKIKRK